MKKASIQATLGKQRPDPVAIVTCSDFRRKDNIITVGWFMQTSLEPVLLAISIGKMRYSHKLIDDSNEFVLSLPSLEQADDVLFCGTHSGRNCDKFKETGLRRIKAKSIKAPLIDDVVAGFECKVVNKLETGDHTIFVGEVLVAYVSEHNKECLYDYGNGSLKGIKHFHNCDCNCKNQHALGV